MWYITLGKRTKQEKLKHKNKSEYQNSGKSVKTNSFDVFAPKGFITEYKIGIICNQAQPKVKEKLKTK
jgi:hypothetical protein